MTQTPQLSAVEVRDFVVLVANCSVAKPTVTTTTTMMMWKVTRLVARIGAECVAATTFNTAALLLQDLLQWLLAAELQSIESGLTVIDSITCTNERDASEICFTTPLS
jgi:hypothetical protein